MAVTVETLLRSRELTEQEWEEAEVRRLQVELQVQAQVVAVLPERVAIKDRAELAATQHAAMVLAEAVEEVQDITEGVAVAQQLVYFAVQTGQAEVVAEAVIQIHLWFQT